MFSLKLKLILNFLNFAKYSLTIHIYLNDLSKNVFKKAQEKF